MMFERTLDVAGLVKSKSIFLLGARQTGKSSLLGMTLPKDSTLILDMLDSALFRELSIRPERLSEYIESHHQIVVIDEVQKVPTLLNEVHRMIERNKKLRFLMTGSSARSLKKSGTNLLGGRAWQVKLHPLTTHEIGEYSKKSILRMLNFGSLPSVYLSNNPKKDLEHYVGTYLKEEIRAEAIVRKYEAFSRFLETSAFSNGEVLNFTDIGSDAQIPPRTIIEYFRVLQDTLVGELISPVHLFRKRKEVSSSKFYFFDLGVANILLKRFQVEEGGEAFGRTLEHLVFRELRSALDYLEGDLQLGFWSEHQKHEIDFMLNKQIAIEVKATANISAKHCAALCQLDSKSTRKVIVCTERRYRKTSEGIEIFPYIEFFKRLWGREFF